MRPLPWPVTWMGSVDDLWQQVRSIDQLINQSQTNLLYLFQATIPGIYTFIPCWFGVLQILSVLVAVIPLLISYSVVFPAVVGFCSIAQAIAFFVIHFFNYWPQNPARLRVWIVVSVCCNGLLLCSVTTHCNETAWTVCLFQAMIPLVHFYSMLIWWLAGSLWRLRAATVVQFFSS